MAKATKRNPNTAPLVQSAKGNIQSNNIMAAAGLDYFKRGFNPVLLKPRDKEPAPMKGWQHRRLTEAEVPLVFNGSCNVGLQLGPASGGLVDVEFDSDTMRTLAPRFIPATRAVFGRTSKPRSHWLYRCPDLHDGQHGAAISIKDAEDKEMASLRIGDDGKGAQSMAPPSIHPSGEPVEWADGCGPEPAEVSVELERQFRHCGVAALLADHWPRAEGSRNDIANAAAGWLAMREVGEEQAAEIIGAAAEYAQDDEIKSRRRCVRDTYRKYEKGEPVVGWTTLTKLLDGRAAKALAKALAAKSRFPDLTKDGAPRANSPHNAAAAITMLNIECRYNLFSLQYSIDGHILADFVGDLSDPALFRLREMIFDRFRLHTNINTVKEAIYTLANHRRFHPVCDYLDGLRWDDVPRIDKWLITYAGAEDSEYTRAVGALVLVAAVRRVRIPGCKFDETLVLEGEQGHNKSQALKILAVKPEWFSDSLSFNLRGREAIEQTTGIWIAEIPELRGLRVSDLDKRKAFQSRDTDIGRLAYGYTVTRAPRQYVPIATTNDPNYLDDKTGNRRFWPVGPIKFDLEALKRDVDQLWAEAAAREASGVSIRLPEELWPVAAKERQKREIENPFVATLDSVLREKDEMENGAWVEGKPMEGKITAEDVWRILGIQPVQRSQKHNENLGIAMLRLGWRRVNLRVGGGGHRAYHFVRGPQPYKRINVTGKQADGTPAIAYYDDERSWPNQQRRSDPEL
jgi:Virulence-associated protein E/Bifunctional DNA primase/polymerase, N-terminal